MWLAKPLSSIPTVVIAVALIRKMKCRKKAMEVTTLLAVACSDGYKSMHTSLIAQFVP